MFNFTTLVAYIMNFLLVPHFVVWISMMVTQNLAITITMGTMSVGTANNGKDQTGMNMMVLWTTHGLQAFILMV
jgi:hypothetical protein